MHLVGALMEQFLKAIAILRLKWAIPSRGPLGQLLNEDTLFFVSPKICHHKSSKWLGPFYQRHSKCNLTISFYWIVIVLSILLLQFQVVHFGLYCQWTPKTILVLGILPWYHSAFFTVWMAEIALSLLFFHIKYTY